MNVTIQNIPFFCLFWIGIGFVFIILGIFMMASHTESNNHYVEFTSSKVNNDYNKEVGEIFSYFLEEEEKKNQGLREMVAEAMSQKNLERSLKPQPHVLQNGREPLNDSAMHSGEFNDIIKLYEEGLGTEEIAKKLKKGVGEVNLMISLYTMR